VCKDFQTALDISDLS